MIYIAKCYVGQYKPGEAFDADIPAKELKRLLERGAIEQTGKTLEQVIDESEDQAPTDSGEDDDDSREDDAEDCEAAQEPEAPEIDVMDGISGGDEPAADDDAKPKGRRSRK